VRREIGWQTQTLAWQAAVTDATQKMEEELVMTYQVITDLATRGGDGGAALADPAMRERMWATMQAKQALRVALQNTPGGAAAAEPALDASNIDDDSDERSTETDAASDDDDDQASSPAPSSRAASLQERWKASGDVAGGSSSGSLVPEMAVAPGDAGDAKKTHKAHAHAADPNARTTTVSSMRRHRAGAKAKAAKAAKMEAFNE
jgi:hypothetical protein